MSTDISFSERCYDSSQVEMSSFMETVEENAVRLVQEDILHIDKPEYTIKPCTCADMVYLNSSNNDIIIYLGTDHCNFHDGTTITFKDVHSTGRHNSYIVIPDNDIKLECYRNGRLGVYTNAGYILNTKGGCVTYTYNSMRRTWYIANQFVGGARC